MRRGSGKIAAAALALSACNPSADEQPTSNAGQPAKIARSESPPPIPPPGTGPDARTPLAEPTGGIDPRSVEAAGQAVQKYGALIEQSRFNQAAELWSDADRAVAFSKGLRPGTHLEIGELGDAEGAAGSSYTTVPVVFYGDTVRRPATIVLRRVNDVPGSTQAQRRWHIERIEWKDGA